MNYMKPLMWTNMSRQLHIHRVCFVCLFKYIYNNYNNITVSVYLWGDSEFSAFAARVFFSRALRFWNQIFTLCSVTLRVDDKSRTSEPERYWVWRNLVSNAANCEVENGILGFLSSLCLREPFRGLDPMEIKSDSSASLERLLSSLHARGNGTS